MSQVSELLLKRFFHGECTAQEAEVVVRWLLDPGNQHLAKEIMQKQWETVEDTVQDTNAEVDIDALLFKTRMALRAKDHRNAKATPRQKWYTTTAFRVAASVAFFLVSAAALITVFEDRIPLEAAITEKREEVRTSTGQIILKVLPDGTKVWLNAQSSLTYPASFGDTREVTLEGEAFFDVAENPAHPFIVHADDIDIRVLGTAFNIKSYPGDPAIATTLVRGKVIIEKEESNSATPIELKPNQQALFSHASNEIKLIQVDAERFSSWTDGSLVFEDDQVYDVFRTLERWYGVSINVPDGSNLSCRLTARIDKESIAETLEMLKTITGIRYTIVGNEVTIEGSVCIP